MSNVAERECDNAGVYTMSFRCSNTTRHFFRSSITATTRGPRTTSRLSHQLARKRPDPNEPLPRFRYSGFTPTQSFAISFLTIFGAGAIGYALSSLLESQGVHLFTTAPLDKGWLDVDPNDESIVGPGTYRPEHGSKLAYDAAIAALRKAFKGKGREDDVSTEEDDLTSHGINEWSYHDGHPASVVVWAER
jgi:hypothetical protein